MYGTSSISDSFYFYLQQLRYITAINTDDLVLELEDAPLAINSWTNDARDAVAALDKQEYDSTTFGAMQVSLPWLCVVLAS